MEIEEGSVEFNIITGIKRNTFILLSSKQKQFL